MSYRVRAMTPDDGEAIALWRYPGPWGVYDLSEPMDPAQGFWAVVGVGMRPDLTGQGRGLSFATAALDHGGAVPGVTALRAVVKDWNTRSIRLLLGLGFTEVGTHAVGGTSYLVLERLGTAPVSPG